VISGASLFPTGGYTATLLPEYRGGNDSSVWALSHLGTHILSSPSLTGWEALIGGESEACVFFRAAHAGSCYRAEYGRGQKRQNPLWNELWAWLPHTENVQPFIRSFDEARSTMGSGALLEATTRCHPCRCANPKGCVRLCQVKMGKTCLTYIYLPLVWNILTFDP
jgi:hypothetical protein